MLDAIAELDYSSQRTSPLFKLCDVGARYGLRQLEEEIHPSLWARISAKARASLRRDLRRDLAQLTRPCLKLEKSSFVLALTAIGAAQQFVTDNLVDQRFLGNRPSDRLYPLFQRFPVLAQLWFQMLSQWRIHIREIVARFVADRAALSRAFPGGRPLDSIADLRTGLSDSHNHGRTVVQLRFEAGSVIYKPRSGVGESEWFSLLSWMNNRGFQPKLRAARVLPRNGYCWMEQVEPASCKNEAAARRFYQRMGGMIAAAHLLKAVDFHRDNFIASGEYPVLVDADALWHVSPVTKTQSVSDVLLRTGFLPNSKRSSLQSRSSTLGPGSAGNHLARIAGKPLHARHYKREIVSGFTRGWRCLFGPCAHQSELAKRLRRIRSKERRWIYWATEKYAAIRRASIQPASLRSATERARLIARLCARSRVTPALRNAEARALKRLDIPYFERRTNEKMPPDARTVPSELVRAIQTALDF